MKIYSNTIIKNGEPFTSLVLNQALPHVEEMIVTISVKSSDGTAKSLFELQRSHPKKVLIFTEDVPSPGKLTDVRQHQLSLVPKGAWVWFLDADDLWTDVEVNKAKELMTDEVDGLGINPYQLVNDHEHDHSWRYKYFTKFFRNDEGVHYRHPWPRDLIYKGDEMLYWRKNAKVPRTPVRFYHLSNLMRWRFRDESWSKEFRSQVGSSAPLPDEVLEDPVFKKAITLWKK